MSTTPALFYGGCAPVIPMTYTTTLKYGYGGYAPATNPVCSGCPYPCCNLHQLQSHQPRPPQPQTATDLYHLQQQHPDLGFQLVSGSQGHHLLPPATSDLYYYQHQQQPPPRPLLPQQQQGAWFPSNQNQFHHSSLHSSSPPPQQQQQPDLGFQNPSFSSQMGSGYQGHHLSPPTSSYTRSSSPTHQQYQPPPATTTNTHYHRPPQQYHGYGLDTFDSPPQQTQGWQAQTTSYEPQLLQQVCGVHAQTVPSPQTWNHFFQTSYPVYYHPQQLNEEREVEEGLEVARSVDHEDKVETGVVWVGEDDASSDVVNLIEEEDEAENFVLEVGNGVSFHEVGCLSESAHQLLDEIPDPNAEAQFQVDHNVGEEVYGDDVETLVMDEDAMPLEQPIIKPVRNVKFERDDYQPNTGLLLMEKEWEFAPFEGTNTSPHHPYIIGDENSLGRGVEKLANMKDGVPDDDLVVYCESLSNVHQVFDENPERDKVTWAGEYQQQYNAGSNWANDYAHGNAELSRANQWANEFGSEQEQHGSVDDQWVNQFSKLHVDDWAEEFGNQVGEGILGDGSADTWANAYDEFLNDQVSAKQRSDRSVYVFSDMNPYVGHLNPLKEGQDMFHKGLLSEAVLALEAEVLKNPENSEGWRLLGIVHAENDDDQQAIAAMMRAQEADPTNLEVLLALGVSHTNELEQSAALKYLYGWPRNHPQYEVLARLELADFLYDADVARTFNEAAQMSPEDADVHIVLGVLYNLSREYDRAIETFRTALKLKPTMSVLFISLGSSLF